MPSFLSPLLIAPVSQFRLENADSHVVVAERIEAAFDSASRRSGLLRRESFPKGSALILAPTNAIHTFFMRFPIDVAFVAKDGTVLKLVRSLQPWRIAASWGAYAAIEFASGSLSDDLVNVGESLVAVPIGKDVP